MMNTQFQWREGVSLPYVCALALGSAICAGSPAWAQNNQFGVQDRANAAARMIVLGVQQGISSLPPTSGQSLTYELDPELQTYVASKRLGPTSFRSPQTVGAGKFSLRVATTYFELADTFGPINYGVNFDEPFPDPATAPSGCPPPAICPGGYAKFGLQASAKVGLVNFGATYGITNRVEVNINVPLVIVDASASQTFSARTVPLPGATGPIVSGAPTIEALDRLLQPGGPLFIDRASFKTLGADFNDGTHVGVGRISLGTKAVVYSDQYAMLAFAPEFFFPSPNENEFAGSESPAVLPRAVAQIPVGDLLRLHVDAGYDYDFDTKELRRVVWNLGVSIPIARATFDFGTGGSRFDKSIQWSPAVAHGARTATFPASTAIAQEGTDAGDTFVDLLGGVKYQLTDRSIISGSVDVPVNNQGFRADAVGTIAAELYF